MRVAAFIISAFAVAACSEAGGVDKTQVTLPLEAPAGAHNLVKDFVEICSLHLSNTQGAKSLAASRGWTSNTVGAEEMVMTNLTGISMLESADTGAMLQFLPAVYPHLEAQTCMILWPRIEASGDEIKLEVIHEIDGLEGGYTPLPGGANSGLGRWSFVADNGQTVTIQAMRTDPNFLQMTMNTHKHINPN